MPTAESNFLIPNGTFIVELIAFLIVLGVMAKYILPPVNKALKERQAAIKAELDAADEAKSDAAAADAERRDALEHARQQGREILEQANRSAERLAAEAQARGQSEYDRLVTSAEAEVRLARQRALDEAASRLGELVVEVVERIIGREMDASAHQDLIDEAVDALARDTGVDDAAADAAAGAGSRP
ncbi:MAG TPA: F0F1 ATP synthase subunit B [Acidimicrobiales bacterium]|nr:F0F1 ATP synthase subunit B [Acidimicrobiales bacterium]